MTISSLTQVYNSLSSNLYGTSSTNVSSTNIGNQQLIDTNSLPTVASQDLVSLSSKSMIDNNQTYTAQGLLQQIQSSILSNDQLLMSDSSTNSSSTMSDSQLQGLLSLPQTSTNNTTKSQDTSSDLSALLKQNPSMAPTLIQSQINQSLMSIFNK